MKVINIKSKGVTHELLLDNDIVLPATPYLTNGYAFMKVYNELGKRVTLSVQRFVMSLGRGEHGKGIFVDHKNGNKLDNRRGNLRLATNQENQANKKSRGYSWNKDRQKFQARVRVNGKLMALGYYTHEEEAQKAYQEAHIKHFGEFSPYFGKELEK